MTAPALAQATNYGRGYLHPITAELVPSITTILRVIPKERLDNWKVRIAAEYAAREWDTLSEYHPDRRVQMIREAPEAEAWPKADLGDRVHEVADNWMKGIPSDPGKAVNPYISQFIRFLAEFKPKFTGTEVTVWSRTAEYAGTADIWCEINGETWVIDIKSGKGIYPEHGLQLAALASADFRILPNGKELPMPQFDAWGILHLRPRSFNLIPIREKEQCYATFLGAREVFRFLNETAELALGDPL